MSFRPFGQSAGYKGKGGSFTYNAAYMYIHVKIRQRGKDPPCSKRAGLRSPCAAPGGALRIVIGSGAPLRARDSHNRERSLKRFNGDDDDPGKALKRWKLWCAAKTMTMKDRKPHRKGPWVFTLLDGKAWEVVENMTLEDIGVDGGDQKIWQVLEP